IPNKIDHGNVSVEDIDKNKGKFDQTYMSSGLLKQITGNAPINAVPANNSLTTEKYVDNSVTKRKKTIGGETATVLAMERLPDINLSEKKVTFYNNTAIIHSKGRELIETETSVPFAPATSRMIIYNVSTKTFKAWTTSSAHLLEEDDVIVAQISFATVAQNEVLNVIGNFEYTVNGRNRVIKDSVHQDEIENGAVSVEKTDFVERGNMFNKNDIERSVALDTATGEKKEVANQNISHEIKVGGGVGLFLKYISGISCFNKNDECLSGWSTNGQEVTYTTPPETEYIKVNVNNYNLDIAMVYIGDTIKDYEPFSVKILGHDITGNIEIENSKESNNVFSPE